MNENSEEQQNAVRKYLLGNLDDKAEMRRIEEKIMLEDDFGEQISIAEDELVDQYLDGTLGEPERERFDRFFLLAPQNKEKLRLTENLRKYAATRGGVQDVKPVSEEKRGWINWRKLFSSPAFGFAGIVLIILALGFGIWRAAFYQSDVDRGLAQMHLAYRGQRPVESRTTANFEYAPPADTRGNAAPAFDEKARRRAEIFLSDAAENSPDAKAHHALGLLYLAEKRFDEALNEFNLALNSAPGDAKIHSDLGATLLEKAKQAEADGKTDEILENLLLSLKSINRALELDNSLLEALFNKGLVLQKMRLSNQSREAWEKYLEKDSASPWAEEARRNLELLKQQSIAPKDKSQVLRDFLDAFHQQNDTKGWEIASQTKELITDVMIAPQLARKFLEAEQQSRKEESSEFLSAFVYLGELEKRNAGDAYFAELADYYSKTNSARRQTLLETQGKMQKGYEFVLKSDWTAALETFQKAKDEFTAAGNVWEANIAEYEICYCLCQAGQIKQSNERLLLLSDFSVRKNYKWMQTLADGWIGSNYDLLGEQSKAIAYNQKSLQTATAIADTYNIQKAFGQLTGEYWLIGDKQNTLSSVYQNLNVGNSYYLSARQNGRNLLFATESFYRFKFYDAAVASAREEIIVSQGEPKSLGLSHAARNHLAVIFGETQKYPEAFREIEASFQIADLFPNEATRQKQSAKTRLILAHLQRTSNDCEKAVENYNQVIQYYENTEFAVNNYEARKGRLLCYVAQKNDSAVSAEMPELFKSFDDYRQKLKESERDSFFNTEQEVYDTAADYAYVRLQNSEQAFNYIENSRARSLLNLVNENSPRPLVLSELRQKIPSGAQMIYYAVLADKLLIWQISDTKFITAEKPIKADELNDAVQNYTKLLTDRREDSQDAAKKLYELLIQPVESTLEPDKSLCIIADKSLFRVPFAALVSPATNKYLIEDYALLYAPSATIFASETEIAAQKNISRAETILSIGNPSFSREEYPALADLPDAAGEAGEVSALYDSPKFLPGKEAVKERVLGDLNTADILHFAGHYVPNSKSPAASKFLLAGSELSVEELMRKKLTRTRLIILSACETGVEKFYNGEGIIGAARAFLASNVPLVVASQWSVNSAATAELMIKFHRCRKQKSLPTIAALRQAQIEMLRDENSRFKQPFYWAGFLPIGGYADY